MLYRFFAAGIRAIAARPGLTVLLYVVNLAAALIVAVPIAVVLGGAVSRTGFDADLAQSLDLVLLFDIFREHGNPLGILASQLFWIVPVAMAWKVAVGVGLVFALQDTGDRSFWTGVGRYFARGFGLAVVFLVVAAVWIAAAVIGGIVLTALWTGEVGQVWSWGVIVPVAGILGLALVDLMQDFGRIALVVRERPVFAAFLEGMAWPFRHGTAVVLYGLWFVPAALLWLLPTFLEVWIGASVVVFVLQQIVLIGRAAVTVGWFGSEVTLYERAGETRADLVAETHPANETSDSPVGFS